jgi:hypothetical protein
MKKSLITTLVAVPVLSLSSMAFAAEAEPVVLSSAQMDGVTAGLFDYAEIDQFNFAPVDLTQLNVLTVGGGNYANIEVENEAEIRQ